MSKADELKSKNENLFERNTILLNENERLKKENAELKEEVANLEGIKLAQGTALNTEYNIKEQLKKEKAELKEQVNILENCNRLGDTITEAYKEQLAQAKEIIAIGLRVCETSSIEYMNLYQKKAEQFLEKVK